MRKDKEERIEKCKRGTGIKRRGKGRRKKKGRGIRGKEKVRKGKEERR